MVWFIIILIVVILVLLFCMVKTASEMDRAEDDAFEVWKQNRINENKRKDGDELSDV